MTSDELLDIAVNNLRDTTEEILKCAADPEHLNQSSQQMNGLRDELVNRLTLCFLLKNTVAEITRK